jgi:hypothetical protein
MNVRYRIELDQSEREQLTELLSGGKHAARKLKRAQILLRAQQMNQVLGQRHPSSQPGFTSKQGQYLAVIYAYTQVLGRPSSKSRSVKADCTCRYQGRRSPSRQQTFMAVPAATQGR